jgi:hypothetical protein
MTSLKLQIGILIGTVILLIVSLAWFDMIAAWRKKLHWFSDPLVGQFVYTAILTAVALGLLMYFNPFGPQQKDTPEGITELRTDERLATTRLNPELLISHF